MKILALRLSNLASIAGEYEINFEATPLAQAGLIAITGKTGAGKSTLLDAMCLALFDQIPRLTGAVGSLTDTSGHGISIKDSKHVLRRGCTHGFAEVEFLALDQKRYLARWEVKRARNKIDGNLKTDRAIKSLEDGRVLTQRISECTPLVQKLIGLSFEQFTRAVLLAQSEVGAFLKAKDQDRADLLEYLTNSSIFSLVSQRSYAKTKQFKDELEQLNSVAGHIELLSTDQVTALTQQKTELSQQIELQLDTQKQLEQQQLWYAQQNQLQMQINTQQQQLAQLDSQQNHIQAAQHWLYQLQQFSEIKSTWLAHINATQQQQQQQQLLERASSELAQHQAAYLQQQPICLKADQARKAHKTQLEQLAPVLDQALQLDSKRSHLQDQFKTTTQQLNHEQQLFDTQQNSLNQLLEQHVALQQQLNQTINSLTQSQDLAQMAAEPKASLEKIEHFLTQAASLEAQFSIDFQSTYSQTSDSQTPHSQTPHSQPLPLGEVSGDKRHVSQQRIKQLSQAQQTLSAQIEAHHAQHGSIEALENQLERTQQNLSTLQQQQQAALGFKRSMAHVLELQRQQQQTAQAIQALQPQLQLHESDLTIANAALRQAEQHLNQLQQMLAEQRILQSEHVAGLRAQLQPEQPCMVCGSTEHPFISHSELLDSALQQIQTEQLQHANDAKNQAQQQQDAANAAHIKQQAELHGLQLQHSQLQPQLELAQQQLQLDYARTGFTFSLEHPQWVRMSEQACATLESELNTLQKQQQDAQNILKHSKALQLQQRQQQQLVDALQQYTQAEHAILTQLNTQWVDKWQQQPCPTANALKQMIQQRVAATQQQQAQQQALQQLDIQVTALKAKQQAQQQQLDTLNAQQQQTLNEGKTIKQQLMALMAQHSPVAYTSAREWQSALQRLHTQLDQQYEQHHSQLQQLERIYTQHKSDCADINSQIKLRQQQIEQMQATQQQWLNQHPEFDNALLQRCLDSEPNEKQQLQQKIEQFNQQYQVAQTQITVYQQQLDQHAQSKPELALLDIQNHLSELSEQIQHMGFARDALSAKLLSHEDACRKVAAFQAQMTQLQQQVNRWTKISELIGSKEGSKFQRIAQEHHLDILVEYANLQLQPLAPRYLLQRIPNSLGLAIIDQDMNDEVRPVLSLSGGETFLVSLALALAIASMASNNTKLESLFIDEGFGTLDPNSLHMVMDALDRLQSQGRKVVLISHVQEMHERIPVQIQIRPVGAGASEICVVG